MSIEEQLDLMVVNTRYFEATMQVFGIPPCRHHHYREYKL
jgi:hypothetical protein